MIDFLLGLFGLYVCLSRLAPSHRIPGYKCCVSHIVVKTLENTLIVSTGVRPVRANIQLGGQTEFCTYGIIHA